MARTKIVVTVGPACASTKMLKRLLQAGADVFRLNFSYGTADEHRQYIARLRRLAERTGRPLAIIGDLTGPRLRCGRIWPEPLRLKKNELVVLGPARRARRNRQGKKEPENRLLPYIPVNYSWLSRQVKPGQDILLDDGMIKLRAIEIKRGRIKCRVIESGLLYSHKGINLPQTRLKLPALTAKDRNDIKLGVKEGVDFFALSFVREPRDIINIRKYIHSLNARIPIIAKIEKSQAFDEIDGIIREADAIMVARGDLGVEIPLEQVPVVQKEIIKKCNQLGKPVIIATQMLESMIYHYRPTRAEVTDIANAIFEGADAVMLSAETAIGKYPLEAVKMMNQVAETTEKQIDYERWLIEKNLGQSNSVTDAISHATCVMASDLSLDAIVCCTYSGYTARMVARHRPRAPIYAFSSSAATVNQLNLCWGVFPSKIALIKQIKTHPEEKIISLAINEGKRKKILKTGDRVVVTMGLPLFEPGTTNMIRVINI